MALHESVLVGNWDWDNDEVILLSPSFPSLFLPLAFFSSGNAEILLLIEPMCLAPTQRTLYFFGSILYNSGSTQVLPLRGTPTYLGRGR